VAREFYKEYNPAFIAHYKKTTGKDVKVDQSHAGSSAQARAVNDGLAADVVTMNTTTDVQFLADNGVVAKDWQKKFPNDASPTTSTMLFMVRAGNPKGIKDWSDLIKPGVKVIVVNPKTGGNGRSPIWHHGARCVRRVGPMPRPPILSPSSTRMSRFWPRAGAMPRPPSCSAASVTC
jgi:sulfate/thiosulfate-binding protein